MWRIGLVVVTVILATSSQALGPKILGNATDLIYDATVKTHTPIDFAAVAGQLAIAASIYLAAGLATWVTGLVINGIVQRSIYRMRRQVSEKLGRLPLSYFDAQPRGELLSRVTNDMDNISQSMQQSLSQVLQSIFTLLGVLIMMFYISWILALVALVTIPLAALVTTVIGKRSQKLFAATWRETGQLNSQIEEAFTGQDLVKVFGRQREIADSFRAKNGQLFGAAFGAQFVSGIIMPVMFFIGNLNYVVIAVVGGLQVAWGMIGLGSVTAFIQYSRNFTQPITQIASMANLLQSGVASAERVFEVLDVEEEADATPSQAHGSWRDEHAEPPRAARGAGGLPGDAGAGGAGGAGVSASGPGLALGPALASGGSAGAAVGTSQVAIPAEFAGRVEFEHVAFSYSPDKPLIKDLSLVAEPGATIAIVGPTGAGKTTLVNLILRFYDVQSGRITLDGIDITKLPRKVLREQIGMVLQDTWLFGGTIRDNIAYGREGAGEEEIVAAAKATYVDRFVRALPDGYDTVINDEASNLSAGEKQLVTIARAFLADPAILILDEATSSVDTRTELLLQRAMTKLRADRTSFVIAHRLSTIRDADTILVMEHGDIVEQGDHDELLAAKGAYYRLYQAQFSGVAEPDAD
ncbi:MAG: ABC transporter ATP-binding protein/permease [Propionibacteriaceae bacterium]|nr:ABC transporter ATP-binding protein/permease [Propionibacteriaceae bacterium]